MSDKIVSLSDRIKELSHTTGTGNLRLDGASTGFGSFGAVYAYDDALFYAVTDGTDYEVGSGQYIQDGGNNALRRFPSKSSNSNALVNFSAGVKEVYVTYPGQRAVFTASGLGGFQEPVTSGLAFWGSSQILDYDPKLTWNASTDMLGIDQSDPQYALHIGGSKPYSAVYVSGAIVGDSGVMFLGIDPSYSGGRQLEPFMRNEVDVTTGTSAVFSLSGVVDQRLLFRQQTAGLVFAGPASGCTPPSTCSPDYPAFRALVADDLPDLSSLYLSAGSGGTVYTAGSGLIIHGSEFNMGNMFYISDTQAASQWIHQANNLVVSGISGVGTTLVTNGTTKTILIDATAISGYNQAYTNSQVAATGAAVSGYNIAYTDSSIIAVSGYNTAYSDSVGVSVSGWNQAYTDAQVASASGTGGGGGMTSWTASDGIGGSGAILDTNVFAVSGISGILTEYNATDKIMQIDGGSLSGWMVGYVDQQVASASGTGGGGMTSWTISDGIGGSEAIADSNILNVSGVSGIDTLYLPGSNLLQISLDASGHTFKKDNIVTVPMSGIVLVGEQVQNGVALVSGDRVLLVNQTDAKENGIWNVGADPYGSWTRPVDFPSSGEASARWTHQQMGTHYDESVWFCVNDNPCTIDYDDQEWRFFDGGAAVSGWVETTYSPILSTSGLLRIPTFGTLVAATGSMGEASVNNSGVIALAGTALIVSDGSSWLSFSSS